MMYHYYLYDKKLQNILSYFCCYQEENASDHSSNRFTT